MSTQNSTVVVTGKELKIQCHVPATASGNYNIIGSYRPVCQTQLAFTKHDPGPVAASPLDAHFPTIPWSSVSARMMSYYDARFEANNCNKTQTGPYDPDCSAGFILGSSTDVSNMANQYPTARQRVGVLSPLVASWAYTDKLTGCTHYKSPGRSDRYFAMTLVTSSMVPSNKYDGNFLTTSCVDLTHVVRSALDWSMSNSTLSSKSIAPLVDLTGTRVMLEMCVKVFVGVYGGHAFAQDGGYGHHSTVTSAYTDGDFTNQGLAQGGDCTGSRGPLCNVLTSINIEIRDLLYWAMKYNEGMPSRYPNGALMEGYATLRNTACLSYNYPIDPINLTTEQCNFMKSLCRNISDPILLAHLTYDDYYGLAQLNRTSMPGYSTIPIPSFPDSVSYKQALNIASAVQSIVSDLCDYFRAIGAAGIQERPTSSWSSQDAQLIYNTSAAQCAPGQRLALPPMPETVAVDVCLGNLGLLADCVISRLEHFVSGGTLSALNGAVSVAVSRASAEGKRKDTYNCGSHEFGRLLSLALHNHPIGTGELNSVLRHVPAADMNDNYDHHNITKAITCAFTHQCYNELFCTCMGDYVNRTALCSPEETTVAVVTTTNATTNATSGSFSMHKALVVGIVPMTLFGIISDLFCRISWF